MEKKERWSEKLLREVENYKCFKNAKVSKLNVWFFFVSKKWRSDCLVMYIDNNNYISVIVSLLGSAFGFASWIAQSKDQRSFIIVCHFSKYFRCKSSCCCRRTCIDILDIKLSSCIIQNKI